MDPGFRSPLVDFFRRGEVARDVRLLAACGALAPRAHEQLALLLILADDPEPLIAASARATLDLLPADALGAFLARDDVPAEMRDFFAARGIVPARKAGDAAQPLLDTAPDPPATLEKGAAAVDKEEDDDDADPAVLSSLPIVERIKLAMKGTRTQRAQLVRDSNKMVAAAVLSSPKLTEAEVEAFSRMANVTEDVLRVIAMNRSWTKNYGVILGLARNPKTPRAISMQLLPRLAERDMKMLSVDRNVPEGVRLAARKYVAKSLK